MDEQNQQNTANEKQLGLDSVAPTPLSPYFSHKNLIIIIIATVILVVAGSVGVYFFFLQQDVIETIDCTQEVKQCSDGSYVRRTGLSCEFAECPSQKEPIKNILNITNWIEYTNLDLGISFRHPKGWKIISRQEDDTQYGGDSRYWRYTKLVIISPYFDPEQIRVDFYYNSLEKTLEYSKYFATLPNDLEPTTLEYTKLNGNDVIIRNEYYTHNDCVYVSFIYTLNEKENYVVSGPQCPNNGERTRETIEIMKTFNFIEKKSSMCPGKDCALDENIPF